MTAPRPGDVVAFEQEPNREFLVIHVYEDGALKASMLPPDDEDGPDLWYFLDREVRVVRSATYTDCGVVSGEAIEESDEKAAHRAKIALARMLRCEHCREVELGRLGVDPDAPSAFDWHSDGRTAYVPVTVTAGPNGDGDLRVTVAGLEFDIPAGEVLVRGADFEPETAR